MTRELDLLPERDAGAIWSSKAEESPDPMDCNAPDIRPGYAADQRRPPTRTDVAWLSCPTIDAPPCAPVDCYADPEMPDCEIGISPGDHGKSDNDAPLVNKPREGAVASPVPMESSCPASQIPCTANGKRAVESDFRHCPIPQSYVRCGTSSGSHHVAEISALSDEDVEALIDIWSRYQDDLTWPWYDKKPIFSHEDFVTYTNMAEKVVNAMVAEYKQPMVLDQATISNTNHKGHPPHADNVQFDSVWWEGKRIRQEDEVVAAREGAYVLWKSEKTSYRSYSCSTSLCDPKGYEGGELQLFKKWGDKDPYKSVKCEKGKGLAFCGCRENIHAVTGVMSGWRLVFLVWTRPPTIRVPESQAHVCYFRPGTGLGVWLTTADQQKMRAPKRDWAAMQTWAPIEEDDSSCKCEKCECERTKISWRDCRPLKKLGLCDSKTSTPSTSVGTSPRACTNDSSMDATVAEAEVQASMQSACSKCSRTSLRHCPQEQGMVRCGPHHRVDLKEVLTKPDVKHLHKIWKRHQDDLSHPWYEKKPQFSDHEFQSFRTIAQKVVDAMSKQYGQPLVLDQATISNTNHIGHPPHADNVQFDSVWFDGKQIKQKDELVAARGGAEVLWRSAKTSYRNFSATVALTEPSEYGGGDLEFYPAWGDKDPSTTYRLDCGSGVGFCGCQDNIHAVVGVKWGFRLVLLIWTRPADVPVPDDQTHVCYFRPGTGLSVWLTTADLRDYPKRRQKRGDSWVPIVNSEESEDKEEWEDNSSWTSNKWHPAGKVESPTA